MIIEHSIAIAAGPALVWAVTCDVERWAEWTPTITSARMVSGHHLGPGSVVRIRQPFQRESNWTVTEFEPGRRFVWRSHRRGLTFTATHQVEPADDGARNLLRVEADGWLATLLWPVMALTLEPALARENRGLKARCEYLAAST